jgi:hypothetical protein
MNKYYFTNNTADREHAREVQKFIMRLVPDLILDNPFYGTDGDTPTKEIAELDAGIRTTVSNAEIVRMDQKKILDSVGIVAYVTRYSWGSPCECYFAHEMLGKPVYIIVPEGSGVDAAHPWVQECSTQVFTSVMDFVKFAKANLIAQKAS